MFCFRLLLTKGQWLLISKDLLGCRRGRAPVSPTLNERARSSGFDLESAATLSLKAMKKEVESTKATRIPPRNCLAMDRQRRKLQWMKGINNAGRGGREYCLTGDYQAGRDKHSRTRVGSDSRRGALCLNSKMYV